MQASGRAHTISDAHTHTQGLIWELLIEKMTLTLVWQKCRTEQKADLITLALNVFIMRNSLTCCYSCYCNAEGKAGWGDWGLMQHNDTYKIDFYFLTLHWAKSLVERQQIQYLGLDSGTQTGFLGFAFCLDDNVSSISLHDLQHMSRHWATIDRIILIFMQGYITPNK